MAVAGPASEGRVRERWRAITVAGAVAVASLLPLTWSQDRDSFPLTSYPMFADPRPDAVVQLTLAIGDTSDGSIVLPTEATGHRHLTQAVKALALAAGEGGDHAARICAAVAAWVATSGPADVEVVRIVTAAFDGIEYVTGRDRTPSVRAEHARCEVAR